jgi:hypothetical protein
LSRLGALPRCGVEGFRVWHAARTDFLQKTFPFFVCHDNPADDRNEACSPSFGGGSHMRPAHPSPGRIESTSEALLRRALRFRRRGEHRRAMVMLREAAYSTPSDAKLWTQYAVACVRLGRRDDAAEALKQAVWLRQRENDEPRLRVTRALLERLLSGRGSLRLYAA